MTAKRGPCFRDGLICDGDEGARHHGVDYESWEVDRDPALLPDFCGNCKGSPRQEAAEYLANGETCAHQSCAEGRYYEVLAGRMNPYSGPELEEMHADRELMRDEMHR
jgi:hypothetical protein